MSENPFWPVGEHREDVEAQRILLYEDEINRLKARLEQTEQRNADLTRDFNAMLVACSKAERAMNENADKGAAALRRAEAAERERDEWKDSRLRHVVNEARRDRQLEEEAEARKKARERADAAVRDDGRSDDWWPR